MYCHVIKKCDGKTLFPLRAHLPTPVIGNVVIYRIYHSHQWMISYIPYCLSLFLSLWLYSPLNLCRFFSFLTLYTVGRTPWTGDQAVARTLPTHITTQTHNKCTQISMPRVKFKPTTPVFEWEKMVHALDRAATVIGYTL
jgi:hypothetical protein